MGPKILQNCGECLFRSIHINRGRHLKKGRKAGKKNSSNFDDVERDRKDAKRAKIAK